MKFLKIAALIVLPLALLIYIRSVQSWRPVTLMTYRKSADSVAFSPDGKLLATGGSEADVTIWDVGEKRIVRVLSSHPGRPSQVAWSPDGRWIAASLDGFYNDERGELRLWDAQSGKLKRTWTDSRSMTGVAFSGDGKTVAGSGYNSVSLWNAENGKTEHGVSVGDTFWVSGVALPSDAQTVIGLGERDAIYIWKVPKVAGSDDDFPHPYPQIRGQCAAFTPDGKTLAVGADGRVIFYDARTWKVRRKFGFPQSAVTAVAFSPVGKLFAAGSDNAAQIKLWNLQSGQLMRTLQGHSKKVNSLSLAPDGDTLASSSADGTVRLWRLR